mgnify:CR=1 FL=1
MPKLAISPSEAEEQRKNILARQKVLLQHVPAWLRHLGVTQRELAEHLGVSEGSVSKWFSGGEAIKAGRIVEIAAFLQMDPTDLLGSPPGERLSVPVAELLEAVEGLSADEISSLAGMARLIQGKRRP